MKIPNETEVCHAIDGQTISTKIFSLPFYDRILKVLLIAVFIFVSLATAFAQIDGEGWTRKAATFNIQRPYNVPENARYWFTNGIYHCLVYSNDAPFKVNTTTLPRTEQRFTPDYTTGEIQYQATLMASSNENSYCVFQIHTGDAQSPAYGSTTFMLFWFSSDGGSVHDYSGTELAKNLGNRWFQLNVDHNLINRVIKVWINKKLVWMQEDNGAGDFYMKDGVYEQHHNPTLQMDAFITNILMWTSPGSPITPQTPRFHSVSVSRNSLIISVTNGAPDEIYYLLCSTNLAWPLEQWQRIMTNVCDANGASQFTNYLNSNLAKEFFRLEAE